MDHSPPGSSVHGIRQARILQWIPISFSRGFSWPGDQTRIFCIGRQIFTTEPPGKPHPLNPSRHIVSELLAYIQWETNFPIRVQCWSVVLFFLYHYNIHPKFLRSLFSIISTKFVSHDCMQLDSHSSQVVFDPRFHCHSLLGEGNSILFLNCLSLYHEYVLNFAKCFFMPLLRWSYRVHLL